MQDNLLKDTFSSAKTIAMVGVSSVKKEIPSNIKRRPSIIVMKYMQDFGYRVIPVNPFSAGQEVNGEKIIANLEDIKMPVDIVDVFRPSEEVLPIAEQAVKINAKVLWLQYGIQNKIAEDITKAAKIIYIANKCIKQEYQRLFLKINPVFPALKN